MRLHYRRRDPNTAYRGRWLWLPRSRVNVAQIESTLSFVLGGDRRKEESVIRQWRDRIAHIGVPRHYLTETQLAEFNQTIAPVVDDYVPPFEHVPFQAHFTLKPEQVAPVNACIAARGGTLGLACGQGKTVIFLQLMATRQVPTLIVVPSKSLLSNWVDHLTGFHETDPDTGVTSYFPGLQIPREQIGIIRGGEVDWEGKPVVVASLHMLAQLASKGKLPLDFCMRWGLIGFDEVHHMSAPWFSQAAPLLVGERVGLSATPKRHDGLEFLYYNHIGPPFYENYEQPRDPRVMVCRLGTDIDMDEGSTAWDECADVRGEFSFSKFRPYLANIRSRNERIAELVAKLREQGHKIMIITHAKDHTYELPKIIPDAVGINGNTHEDERIKLIRQHPVSVVIAQVADEGLNDKNLTCVIFATPFKTERGLVQGIGRALRDKEGKIESLLVLIDDWNVGVIHGMVSALLKIIRELKWEVETHYHDPADEARSKAAKKAARTRALDIAKKVVKRYEGVAARYL
jgi:superfamily II DNA or RNA helicase